MSDLTKVEHSKSYVKYYYMPMTQIPQDKLDILERGPIPHDKILHIENRNQLLDEAYFEYELGYGNAKDGSGYVSNLTRMPGVNKDMLEWWFVWYALEDLRYKIWDPQDHFYARQQNLEKALDKSLPMRERTWGTTHLLLDDIGGGAEELVLEFVYPKDFGFDQDKIGTEACATMMCANVYRSKSDKGVATVMAHMVREVEGGVELRSRFWIGYQIVDGKAVKVLPSGLEVPLKVSKDLFAHNMKEFSHLATILPQIYEEEYDFEF